ncbi:SCF ubiquitin ligase complex protein SKP1b [Linum grandiflorum]
MGTDGAIPLDNVTGSILRRVIKYCRMQHRLSTRLTKSENGTKSSSRLTWRCSLISSWYILSLSVFFTFPAADYLNIKELLDLTCRKAAHMISEKTTEEMRKILNIKNDFTPEEEANIRIENCWAY